MPRMNGGMGNPIPPPNPATPVHTSGAAAMGPRRDGVRFISSGVKLPRASSRRLTYPRRPHQLPTRASASREPPVGERLPPRRRGRAPRRLHGRRGAPRAPRSAASRTGLQAPVSGQAVVQGSDALGGHAVSRLHASLVDASPTHHGQLPRRARSSSPTSVMRAYLTSCRNSTQAVCRCYLRPFNYVAPRRPPPQPPGSHCCICP